MNQIFSLNRIVPFLKYKWVLNYRTWLIQLAAFAGIYTIVSALFFVNPDSNMFEPYYQLTKIVTLLACGFYITSRSYSELSSTSHGFLFVQLPVSIFEKTIVPIVFGGIIFPFLFILFFTGVANLSNLILSWFYHFNPFTLQLFSGDNVRFLKGFLVLQPFFLVGAIKFKKQHLLWTSISLVSISVVFFLIWILIAKHAYGTSQNNAFEFLRIEDTITKKDIVLLLMMIIGWVIAFFKLKEREV